jgi:hypothetical protein
LLLLAPAGYKKKVKKAKESTPIYNTSIKGKDEEGDRGEDGGGPTDGRGKDGAAEDNGGEGSEDEGSFQAKNNWADEEWDFFLQSQRRSKKDYGSPDAVQQHGYNSGIFALTNTFCLAFGFDLMCYGREDIDTLRRPGMLQSLTIRVSRESSHTACLICQPVELIDLVFHGRVALTMERTIQPAPKPPAPSQKPRAPKQSAPITLPPELTAPRYHKSRMISLTTTTTRLTHFTQKEVYP